MYTRSIEERSHVVTDTVAELSQRARELAPEDRARLAEELLASLETDLEPEVDAAWDEEIRRRIAEAENGTAKLIPADEVFARVRRALS
jgi:putative addiction module component (TIGR02574 family)